MNWDSISRRHFLKGAGGVTLALPILPSLLLGSRSSWAAPRKRFVAIHSGHCQAVEQWYPDHTKLSFTQRGALAREAALASIQGPISPILGTAFDPLREKLLLLSRLDPTSSQPNHNAEVVLTGGVLSEVRESVDQVLARRLANSSPLNLYTRSVFDSSYSGASHLSVANGQYSAGQFNPSAVFANLFGTSSQSGSQMARRDLAVVDRVLKEFRALRASARLSKSDRERLDQHMELVSQVERKLSASTQPQAACASPSGPANSPVVSQTAADYGVVLDQMFDLIEVGIKCGRVQVATLMMHVYDYFAGSIGFIPGVSDGKKLHEDIGHAGGVGSELRGMKLALNRWFGERVARFLRNLDQVEDPVTGTTYLDNSLILWANDQGALKETGGHTSINMPVLLAGSAGGFLRTGFYIDYGPAYAPSVNRAVAGDEYGLYQPGRPYNQLLVTILQAMGLQPADYESPGKEGFGFYGDRHAAIFNLLPGNHRREVLPLLKAV